MLDLNLPLFPVDTSAVTVTTTVWVGVCVVALLNIRLGWTLSGLVVPGYLIPLAMIKPAAAGVILGEAVCSYLIVHWLSERPRFVPCWSSLFGRDRFFALVLVSVLVRAIGDGWLLPWLGLVLDQQLGIRVDYRNDLHSYGLIIVALIANYFWKPGLRRGLAPLAVTLLATYLLVRYALTGMTNFNIGALQHMYEDISVSLLSSPKAYIIVITTAYLASWANLRYSWEFNGILVPALLGLLWYDPAKIATSVVEGVLVLCVAKAILKLPCWQRTTVEGGRKILIFFSICFVYRLALAHLVPVLSPETRVTDTFGFGYLLSTLMAIKAHEKQLTIRVLRSTIQISLVGAVAGSLIGFALTWLPSGFFWLGADAKQPPGDWSLVRCERDLVDCVHGDQVLLYQTYLPGRYQSPVNYELARFQRALEVLRHYRIHRQPDSLEEARRQLASLRFELVLVRERYLYIRERSPARGWGLFVIDLNSAGQLCVEVPSPLEQRYTFESGLGLYSQLQAASLAIAGSAQDADREGSANVLTSRHTMFAVFHRVFGRHSTLQVRGLPSDSRQSEASLKSQLWVRKSLPESLRLSLLKQRVPRFDVLWQETPEVNVLRQEMRGGFAELRLSPGHRHTLLVQLGEADSARRKNASLAIVQGHLRDQVVAAREAIAECGSDAYRVARTEELLYLKRQVLLPLVQCVALRPRPRFESARGDDETLGQLQALAAASHPLGYRLQLLHDRQRDETYVLLMEVQPPRRHWGTYVFRWGMAEPYLVEVPRPVFEKNTVQFGASMFERLPASALLLAGAHPRANRDGSADVARLANHANLFNLVHQTLLRQSGALPMLVLQARAIQSPVDADVILATDQGRVRIETLSPLQARVAKRLVADGLRVRIADGRPATAGYELGFWARGSTLRHSANKQVVGLWLSPSLRISYREQRENLLLAAQMSALQIPTVQDDLVDYLYRLDGQPAGRPVPAELKRDVLAYVVNFDIVRLQDLRETWPAWRWTHLIDQGSGQAYLLLFSPEGTLPALVHLIGFSRETPRQIVVPALGRKKLLDFVESRATWLEFCSGRAEP